jgi:hypothetical protein
MEYTGHRGMGKGVKEINHNLFNTCRHPGLFICMHDFVCLAGLSVRLPDVWSTKMLFPSDQV